MYNCNPLITNYTAPQGSMTQWTMRLVQWDNQFGDQSTKVVKRFYVPQP